MWSSFARNFARTTLRKQIATYHAVRGISDVQTSDLANFMGHDKQIHKDVYRVPNSLRDVTRVSTLLQSALGTRNNTKASNSQITDDTNSTQQLDNIVAHERSDTFTSVDSNNSKEYSNRSK